MPSGTSGVCIMQVLGGSPGATTLQLRVYDGSLTYYRSHVLVQNTYNKWFRMNVIHHVSASNVKVYIDRVLKYDGAEVEQTLTTSSLVFILRMILPTAWNLVGRISNSLERIDIKLVPF